MKALLAEKGIVLEPYDIWRRRQKILRTFEEEQFIALSDSLLHSLVGIEPTQPMRGYCKAVTMKENI